MNGKLNETIGTSALWSTHLISDLISLAHPPHGRLSQPHNTPHDIYLQLLKVLHPPYKILQDLPLSKLAGLIMKKPTFTRSEWNTYLSARAIVKEYVSSNSSWLLPKCANFSALGLDISILISRCSCPSSLGIPSIIGVPRLEIVKEPTTIKTQKISH